MKAGSGAHLYALYEGISLVPRTLHQELFEALCSLLRQSSQDHIRGKRIAIARLSLQTMSRLLHLPYDSRQISRMIVNSWRDCLRWLSLLIDRLSDASELEEAVLSPFFMLATSLQASNNDGYLREKMARKIAARLWLYAGFQLKQTTMASKLLFWTLSEPPTNPEYDVLLEVCAHAEIIAERSQSLLKAASSSRERLIIAGDTEPLVISHLFLFRALVYVYRFALALKHRKALVTLVLVIRKVLGEKTRFEETPTLGVSKAFAALRLLFVLPPKVDVAIKPGLLQAIDCANSATFYNREYDYEDNIRSNIQTIMENLTLRVGCTPSTASIAMESVLDLQSAGRLCDEVKSGPRRIIGWQNFETALTVSTSFLKCSYKDNIEILYEECDNVRTIYSFIYRELSDHSFQIRCCRSFSAVRLFRCSACGVVAYCSKECQRYSWTSLDHKSVCKALDFFRRVYLFGRRFSCWLTRPSRNNLLE